MRQVVLAVSLVLWPIAAVALLFSVELTPAAKQAWAKPFLGSILFSLLRLRSLLNESARTTP